MNKTQNLVFKKALVMFMAIIMVFTYMPSMAWAEEPSTAPHGYLSDLSFARGLKDSGNIYSYDPVEKQLSPFRFDAQNTEHTVAFPELTTLAKKK